MSDENNDELQLPLGNSHNGTGASGYQVQARYMNNGEAKEICGMLLGSKWKTITFPKSSVGVPTCRPFEFHLPATHCMTIEAAQALRWWFRANAVCSEMFGGGLCLETRIVRFKIDYSVKCEAESVLEEPEDSWRSRTI